MAPIWIPSAERVATARMTAFMARQGIDEYRSLYQWSIEKPEEFWPAVWDFTGIKASRRWDRVVDGLDRMPGAKWFDGARLNFAENLLRRNDEAEAIVAWNESGRQRSLTFGELRRRVSGLATTLRSWGIVPGDRIAAYLPNIPETVIAMLASVSLGAIWSSCSPDFGLQGVHDRFGQIEPKVLFGADGYVYAGKTIDCRDRFRALRDRMPSVERTVSVPYLGLEFDEGVAFDEAAPGSDTEPAFEQFPFDHPLYILYSSGTTGVPKCIVHGAGGTLLQHLKEHVLHTNLGPGSRMLYFTTCGWMMWNWLVSALAAGSTIVLYDGSPLHPPGILFQLAEQERLTVFGASAKYFSAIEKHGLRPIDSFELEPLKTILSTGSPLSPESFDYIYSAIKQDVCLSSISGGTDIVSCFALGNPIEPVYRGELQTRGLGMKVEVFDEEGRSVREEKGELVCEMPFPSMPLGFWNDPEGVKYRDAYFSRFPNVWHHGDYAMITEHDGMVIYGRSDAVLNPGGVRIGTAEIYRLVEQLPEIQESLVVGQDWDGDVRVVLFVRLMDGRVLDDELRDRIKTHIRRNASPRHVPAKIIAVGDIPRTVSGKITELAVRNIIHGRPVRNVEALANPGALDLYTDLPELRS